MSDHLNPHRPLPVKSINLLGKVLSGAGLDKPALDSDAIFNKAYKKSGSLNQRDYSELKRRLGLLCDSLNSSGNLHQTGRLITYLSLLNTFKTRIEIDDWIDTHPEITDRKIEKPVFILGLPRTGTTALFNLINSVEGIRAPLGWEINKPVPPVKYAEKDTDPRIKKTHQEFEAFFYLTPNLRMIHDFGALLPQECIAATQYDFYTGQFFYCYDVPTYFECYKSADTLEVFKFHKRFFQLLQSDFPEQRWLFKTPFHIGSLPELFETYPDARIIQTHRNPMEVLGSNCSFAWHLRSTFSDQIDNQKIGKEQLEFWSANLDKVVKDRETLNDRSHQFHDVDYKTFVNNPVDVVNGILDFLEIERDESTSARLIEHVNSNQKDKHGKHVYFLEDYGLDAERDSGVFESYCKRFGL